MASALVAVLGVALTAGPAAAAAPTVLGRVTGALPPSSRAVTEIRAFEAGSARLVATATASPTGVFRLSLPPGGYVLATNVTPKRGPGSAAVQRVIALTLARGQRRGAVKIAKPTARASAAVWPLARAAYSQESGAITPGAIAFSVENFTGATGELGVMNRGLSDLLQTDLVNAPCRHAEVANSSDRVLVERELAFQKSKYVDPSTRVTRNFVLPDIVVSGRLQNRGGNLAYALVLVDSRTGATLETVSGSLSGSDIFGAEQSLAARLAKRICSYGEVFEVTFTGTGTGTFATHSATGTLSAEAITAKPVAKDGQGPNRWEGSAPVSWTGVSAASNTDCAYGEFVSGGMWSAKLARVGGGLQVQWFADKGATGTATAVCPTANGGSVSIPGQPTTSLIGSEPGTFILPTNAKQQVTGGLSDPAGGWNNTLELKVRTLRVQRLG